MAQLDLHCPTCGQFDMVQKVSIVAEGDVTQRYGEYGTYTYPTHIARSLARPNKPTRRSAGGAFGFAIIFLIVGGAGVVNAESSEFLVFSCLFLVFGILLGIAGFSADARDKKEYEAKLARWSKADEKWNQLYYCRRDETVFNPYDGESMQITDMNQYLGS